MDQLKIFTRDEIIKKLVFHEFNKDGWDSLVVLPNQERYEDIKPLLKLMGWTHIPLSVTPVKNNLNDALEQLSNLILPDFPVESLWKDEKYKLLTEEFYNLIKTESFYTDWTNKRIEIFDYWIKYCPDSFWKLSAKELFLL
jgi:hypothetical protein